MLHIIKRLYQVVKAHTLLCKGAAILLVGASQVACKNFDLLPKEERDRGFQQETSAHTGRRVPAEWEEHQSIWMAWPTYNNKHNWDAQATYAELIKTLITTVPVDLCVTDADMQQQVQAYLQDKGVAASQFGKRIRFRIVDYGDIWLRDTGPVFVRQGKACWL